MKAYTQNGELKVTPGAGGGGGSVTSAQFQTLSARVAGNSAQMTSANNAISNAVSVLSGVVVGNSAQMTSADNAISAAVAALSAQHTSLAGSVAGALSAIAANSAQMTSADNALSAAINVVSNAASNALSVANAVSNRLSTWTLGDLANVSVPTPADGQVLAFNSAENQWIASTIVAGAGSVTSAELQAVSAAAASADATLSARIDSVMTVVSNQGSAIVANSAQMTSADNAISAAAAAVSVRLNSTNTVVSNQGSAIVANSAQMTSADNALSAAINIVSNAASNALSVANAVSNRLSTWTLDNLANVSAPAPTDGQVLAFNSAENQWVASTPAAGAISVPGADGDVIFNSAGVLGAEAALNWNRTANALQISGTLNLLDGGVSGQIRADSATNLGFWFQGNGGVQFDNFVNFTQGATFNLGATFESAVSAIFNDNVTFQNGKAIRIASAENLYLGNDFPAQITSNQTAWNPGAGNTFQVDSDASTREIQGILNDGEHRIINLINYGAFDILLMHENGAASALDRIATPDGGTFTLSPGQAVKLGWYETATGQRWVIMSRSQAGAGGGSVTSAEVQAVSAAAASADATLSARIDSVMTVVSNQGSAIVANSAQMTSADNAISAAAAAVSVRLNSTNTVVSNQGSAIVANSAQMTSADNAISAAVVALSAQHTSLAASVAGAISAVSAVNSNLISLASDVGRISTLVAAGLVSAGPVKKFLAGAQNVTATAPTSLSGFTFTVSGGVAYAFEFGIFTSVAAASLAGIKFVISAPTGGMVGQAILGGGVLGSAVNIPHTNFTVQQVTVSSQGVAVAHKLHGVFMPTGAGTLALAVGNNVSTSTAASVITIIAGSYGYVWRMAP